MFAVVTAENLELQPEDQEEWVGLTALLLSTDAAFREQQMLHLQ